MPHVEVLPALEKLTALGRREIMAVENLPRGKFARLTGVTGVQPATCSFFMKPFDSKLPAQWCRENAAAKLGLGKDR